MEKGRTHTFEEMLTPSLVLPRQLRGTLETNEEFALEIQEFVEIREKEMNCILIH